MRSAVAVAALVASSLIPSSAFAQRFPFERTFDVTEPNTLDVSTVRGKIDVRAGQPGCIVVEGTATVRVGFNVPVNAVDLAKQVAASPPIEQAGPIVRLHIPADRDAQRAVTVSYVVHVPPKTEIRTSSESGQTSIRGTSAAVDIRTQSAAIDVNDLSGTVEIATGSGAVTAGAIAGPLSVKTTSSAFTGTHLGSSLRVRTQSGRIEASFQESGDVDVETGSSAVTLRGVRGGLAVRTQSGQLTLAGVPLRNWTATTGSSSITLELEPHDGFVLDAASRSGNVTVDGKASIAATKHAAKGQIGQGGPLVRARTGSGAIRVRLGER